MAKKEVRRFRLTAKDTATSGARVSEHFTRKSALIEAKRLRFIGVWDRFIITDVVDGSVEPWAGE